MKMGAVGVWLPKQNMGAVRVKLPSKLEDQ